MADGYEFDLDGTSPEEILKAILPESPHETPMMFIVSMLTTGEVRVLGNKAITMLDIAIELERISRQLKAQVASQQ